MNDIYYNLFLRNWQNNRATESDIEVAVKLGYIKEEQGNNIKSSERIKSRL